MIKVFFLVLIGSFLMWVNTSAHSYLAAVEPPLGTVFDESPEFITLIFTQGPDTGPSEYFLESADGEPISTFTPVYEGEVNERVILNFDETLADGNYRIAWKAISTTDGHPTRGIVPLAIGVEPAESTSEVVQTEVTDPSVVRMIVRWLIFLSMTIMVGSLLFPLIAPNQLVPPVRSQKPLLLGSFFVLILFGLIDLLIQSQEVGASITNILLESQWGLYQLTKYIFALAIGALIFSGIQGRLGRLFVQLLSLGVLLAQSLASHNASLGLVGTISDWVHLLAASLWLGGLVQLAWIWMPQPAKRSNEDRLALMQTLIPRFSQLALISVILILISGVYTAYQHIPNLDALFSSMYGRALLAKGILLLPIIALAAVNRFVLVPKMKQWVQSHSEDHSLKPILSRFRRLVAVEALLIVAVLFFAGVLTTASPPHLPGAHRGHHEETAEVEPPFLIHHAVEDMMLEIQIEQIQDQQRVLTAKVLDLEQNSLDTVLRVSFAFEYLGEDLGDTFFQIVADKINEGESYRLEGGYLTLPGPWKVDIIVRIRQRLNDLEVTFPLEVSEHGKVQWAESEALDDHEEHDE